ncbi:hypothetical protein TSOC_004672 [Tetrabaena socialis]|uniref:Uncharacterized protein n=1 Tax=Tetrabaena socialis TaxID=47790 RepID=A0A2J8A8A9_9CHLO|nr:hypothetical protein TSOC_004672 [Tetrabaena socialis]|eukprot:PNH08751.1 hypothetical protein TSOC_004672 [Tetrabaena socialis]
MLASRLLRGATYRQDMRSSWVGPWHTPDSGIHINAAPRQLSTVYDFSTPVLRGAAHCAPPQRVKCASQSMRPSVKAPRHLLLLPPQRHGSSLVGRRLAQQRPELRAQLLAVQQHPNHLRTAHRAVQRGRPQRGQARRARQAEGHEQLLQRPARHEAAQAGHEGEPERVEAAGEAPEEAAAGGPGEEEDAGARCEGARLAASAATLASASASAAAPRGGGRRAERVSCQAGAGRPKTSSSWCLAALRSTGHSGAQMASSSSPDAPASQRPGPGATSGPGVGLGAASHATRRRGTAADQRGGGARRQPASACSSINSCQSDSAPGCSPGAASSDASSGPGGPRGTPSTKHDQMYGTRSADGGGSGRMRAALQDTMARRRSGQGPGSLGGGAAATAASAADASASGPPSARGPAAAVAARPAEGPLPMLLLLYPSPSPPPPPVVEAFVTA